jgi:hypothetical protein
VGGTVPDAGPSTAGLAMALAALNAVGVHAAVSAVRAGSTSLTMGTANPLVSLAEDVAAACGVGLALFAPYAGALLAAALTLTLVLIVRSGLRALRVQRAAIAQRGAKR